MIMPIITVDPSEARFLLGTPKLFYGFGHESRVLLKMSLYVACNSQSDLLPPTLVQNKVPADIQWLYGYSFARLY